MDIDIKIATIKEFPMVITQVKNLGDRNSKTLGFLPSGAFEDVASKGLILIALKGEALLGYLLYREVKRKNQIAIVHLCVDELFRGLGVAEKLINEIKSVGKGGNGIFLWCRQDYEIVDLWNKHGFLVRDEKPGKAQVGSLLEKWIYTDEMNAIQTDLWQPSASQTPVVIDANTFFDLRADDDESKESKALLSDWIQDIELFVTKELFNEIRRNGHRETRSACRQYAETFPLIQADERKKENIKKRLDLLLNGAKTRSFESDKSHIAWAICGGADYFVTRDLRLLNASQKITDIFGLKVLRPSQLIIRMDSILNQDSYRPNKLFNSEIEIKKIGSKEYNKLAEFFLYDYLGEKKGRFQEGLSNVFSDLLMNTSEMVEVDGVPAVFFSYIFNCFGAQEVNFLRATKSPLSLTVLYKIVVILINKAIYNGFLITVVQDEFLREEVVDVLEEFGFYRTSGKMVKVHFAQNKPPSLKDFSNNKNLIDLVEPVLKSVKNKKPYYIERAFWPCKFLNVGVPNFIISIEPFWAKELFDENYAVSDLFGPAPELILNHRNVYYRAGAKSGIEAHSRILWYVKYNNAYPNSGAIRATSLLEDFEIGRPKKLFKKYMKYGVYQWENIYSMVDKDLDKDIMAIQFHSTEMLKTPIDFHKINAILKEYGINSNNFQSPLKVSDDVFNEIYSNVELSN